MEPDSRAIYISIKEYEAPKIRIAQLILMDRLLAHEQHLSRTRRIRVAVSMQSQPGDCVRRLDSAHEAPTSGLIKTALMNAKYFSQVRTSMVQMKSSCRPYQLSRVQCERPFHLYEHDSWRSS